jgi:uncharacterized Tic20 family protein
MTTPPHHEHGDPGPGRRGTAAWALGFLAFVPVPVVAQIMTGLVMAGAYPTHKQRGAVAHANARHAANWGLTFAVLTVVLVGLAIVFATILSIGGGAEPGQVPPLPLIPLALWLGLCVVHLVVVVIGTVVASQGAVFRFPLAIRFVSD